MVVGTGQIDFVVAIEVVCHDASWSFTSRVVFHARELARSIPQEECAAATVEGRHGDVNEAVTIEIGARQAANIAEPGVGNRR